MAEGTCAHALAECLIYSASLSLWYYSLHHERSHPTHRVYFLTAVSLATLGRLALMLNGCNGTASVLMQGVFATELPLAVVGTCSQLLRWAETTNIALCEDGSRRLKQVTRSLQISAFLYGSISTACVLSGNGAGSLLAYVGSIGLALVWVGLLSTFAVAICWYGLSADGTSLGCLVFAMLCLGVACLSEGLTHVVDMSPFQKNSIALVHGPGFVTLWIACAVFSLSAGEVLMKDPYFVTLMQSRSGSNPSGISKVGAEVEDLI